MVLVIDNGLINTNRYLAACMQLFTQLIMQDQKTPVALFCSRGQVLVLYSGLYRNNTEGIIAIEWICRGCMQYRSTSSINMPELRMVDKRLAHSLMYYM
jgi:hypothetical protein